MSTLCVSPHFDDAVFSCGDYLAGRSGVRVLTIFGGSPPAEAPLTDWDRACGFSTGRQAMAARRDENRRALAAIGAKGRACWFLDVQYRDPARSVLGPLTTVVREAMRQVPWSEVLIPAGIEHPDHLVTAEACRAVGFRGRLGVYEEQPYASAHPDQVTIPGRGWSMQTVPVESTPEKAAAVACYRSQVEAVGRMGDVLVPERIWWRP